MRYNYYISKEVNTKKGVLCNDAVCATTTTTTTTPTTTTVITTTRTGINLCQQRKTTAIS